MHALVLTIYVFTYNSVHIYCKIILKPFMLTNKLTKLSHNHFCITLHYVKLNYKTNKTITDNTQCKFTRYPTLIIIILFTTTSSIILGRHGTTILLHTHIIHYISLSSHWLKYSYTTLTGYYYLRIQKCKLITQLLSIIIFSHGYNFALLIASGSIFSHGYNFALLLILGTSHSAIWPYSGIINNDSLELTTSITLLDNNIEHQNNIRKLK